MATPPRVFALENDIWGSIPAWAPAPDQLGTARDAHALAASPGTGAAHARAAMQAMHDLAHPSPPAASPPPAAPRDAAPPALDDELRRIWRGSEDKGGGGGVQVALSAPLSECAAGEVRTFNHGQARVGRPGAAVTDGMLFQIASLSKTVGTAFAMEYFIERSVAGSAERVPAGLTLDTPVTTLLRLCGSGFELRAAPGGDPAWCQQLQLRHLMNHTGLGMHYVIGVEAAARYPPPPQSVLLLLRPPSFVDLLLLLLLPRPNQCFAVAGDERLTLRQGCQPLTRRTTAHGARSTLRLARVCIGAGMRRGRYARHAGYSAQRRLRLRCARTHLSPPREA